MMSAEIFPSVLNVNDVLHFLSSYSQNIGLCSVQQEFFSDFFFLFCNEIYIKYQPYLFHCCSSLYEIIKLKYLVVSRYFDDLNILKMDIYSYSLILYLF